MTTSRLAILALAFLFGCSRLFAQQPVPAEAKPAPPEDGGGTVKAAPDSGTPSTGKKREAGGEAPAEAKPATPGATDRATARGGPGESDRLPMSRLAPAKLFPDLCVYRYPVSTASKECQAFVDQGLGYWYSYVWMEAVRSFETAAKHDPDCALAYWGLFRAFDRWGKREMADKALLKANELAPKASYRERQLILASMQERGHAPGVGDAEARKKAAIATIDNLLAIHDDDEEAWYYRAFLAGGTGFGGAVSAVPYFKALLKVNPLHPGANHELVHFYENYKRPALGWAYAENYIKSSPGIPHAFHMQAHLGTRIGKWNVTANWSARAIELEQAYHKAQNVRPTDDHQYSHHLETLLVSLIHDGRYRQGRQIKADANAVGFKLWMPVFKLALAERDWPEALKVADYHRKRDKNTASYLAALVYLKQGDPRRAAPEVEVLRNALRDRKTDKQLEARLWETQGLLLCQTGDADAGLSLLQRAVNKTKDEYGHHAWGNGSYHMEAWGIAALQNDRYEVAEEAFLEALAHDPGSARAALGLQVMCERLGRSEEAARYAELANRCWARADSGVLQTELDSLRSTRYTSASSSRAGAGR